MEHHRELVDAWCTHYFRTCFYCEYLPHLERSGKGISEQIVKQFAAAPAVPVVDAAFDVVAVDANVAAVADRAELSANNVVAVAAAGAEAHGESKEVAVAVPAA